MYKRQEVNQNRREMDKHMSIYLSDNSFKETVINIIDNASHVEEEAMANLLIGFNFENDTCLLYTSGKGVLFLCPRHGV